jgi:hypothetical protein
MPKKYSSEKPEWKVGKRETATSALPSRASNFQLMRQPMIVRRLSLDRVKECVVRRHATATNEKHIPLGVLSAGVLFLCCTLHFAQVSWLDLVVLSMGGESNV